MRLPTYDECGTDDAYVEALTTFAALEGLERSPHDSDHSWVIRVRCHAAGIELHGTQHRYTCIVRNGDDAELVVIDNEDELFYMPVRERYALMVLAALNMYDRQEKKA